MARRSPGAVGGTTAAAIGQAAVNVPGTKFSEGLGAGLQAAAPFVEGQVQAQQAVTDLNEKEMGMAFRELLNAGLEGAQAYVQDMQKADPEIGNKAAQQLQSIAPLFADPNLQGGTAQRALESFYNSVDNQWKLKNEPDFFEKEKFKTNERIRQAEATKTLKPTTPADKKLARQRAALPGLRKRLAAVEKRQPKIEEIPEVKSVLEDIKTDLANVVKEFNRKSKGDYTFLEKARLKTGSGKKDELAKLEDEIKSLRLIVEDPESQLVPYMQSDPKVAEKIEKKILGKHNKRRSEWLTERNRISNKILDIETVVGDVAEEPGEIPVVPITQGTPSTPATKAPAQGLTAITNAAKLKEFQNALATTTDPAQKQRIQAAIDKLKRAGIKAGG